MTRFSRHSSALLGCVLANILLLSSAGLVLVPGSSFASATSLSNHARRKAPAHRAAKGRAKANSAAKNVAPGRQFSARTARREAVTRQFSLDGTGLERRRNLL